MADRFDKAKRSWIMSRVRSRGNWTTEVALGKLLWKHGLKGYRKHWPVPGRPDFAWPGRQVAVFVDGCFWHGCNCKSLPTENARFWQRKILDNSKRDKRVTAQLRRMGWSVIRVKECKVARLGTLSRIAKVLKRRLLR